MIAIKKLKTTPKSFILSILHVSNEDAIPIKALVHGGKIFGFSSNSIRVNTTRLIREGIIESDERGLYRLCDSNNPIRKFINSWRLGESRTKPWDGSWIACLLPKVPVGQLKKSKNVLRLLGFRDGLTGFWIRPQNMTFKLSEIREFMRKMESHSEAEVFIAGQFDKKLCEKWKQYLWPIDDLAQSHKKIIKKLKESASRLHKMPIENALVESYILGSEAIHSLNTDPLLPEEIMSSSYRILLTKTMLEYDELGKNIWLKTYKGFELDKTPSHLRLVLKA